MNDLATLTINAHAGLDRSVDAIGPEAAMIRQ
jgi:hypothetical protein